MQHSTAEPQSSVPARGVRTNRCTAMWEGARQTVIFVFIEPNNANLKSLPPPFPPSSHLIPQPISCFIDESKGYSMYPTPFSQCPRESQALLAAVPVPTPESRISIPCHTFLRRSASSVPFHSFPRRHFLPPPPFPRLHMVCPSSPGFLV